MIFFDGALYKASPNGMGCTWICSPTAIRNNGFYINSSEVTASTTTTLYYR